MKKLVEEWLAFADKDLKTISKIISDECLSNVVAFLRINALKSALKH